MVSIGEGEKVSMFFVQGGETDFLQQLFRLGQVDSHNPILELAGSVDWNYTDRNLYVVELTPKVFDWERRFFEAILHWIPGNHCVHVGEHAAWFVRKYGRRLLPELYEHFNPASL